MKLDKLVEGVNGRGKRFRDICKDIRFRAAFTQSWIFFLLHRSRVDAFRTIEWLADFY